MYGPSLMPPTIPALLSTGPGVLMATPSTKEVTVNSSKTAFISDFITSQLYGSGKTFSYLMLHLAIFHILRRFRQYQTQQD